MRDEPKQVGLRSRVAKPMSLGDELLGKRTPPLPRSRAKPKGKRTFAPTKDEKSKPKEVGGYRLWLLFSKFPKEIDDAIVSLVEFGVAPGKLRRLVSGRKPAKKKVGRPLKWTIERRKALCNLVDGFKLRENKPEMTDKDALRTLLIDEARDTGKDGHWSRLQLKRFQNQISIARDQKRK